MACKWCHKRPSLSRDFFSPHRWMASFDSSVFQRLKSKSLFLASNFIEINEFFCGIFTLPRTIWRVNRPLCNFVYILKMKIFHLKLSNSTFVTFSNVSLFRSLQNFLAFSTKNISMLHFWISMENFQQTFWHFPFQNTGFWLVKRNVTLVFDTFALSKLHSSTVSVVTFWKHWEVNQKILENAKHSNYLIRRYGSYQINLLGVLLRLKLAQNHLVHVVI